jgi:GTPase SAR1 family protein
VGVVGYPNVGKSSLINSLKRSKVRSLDPSLFLHHFEIIQLGMRRRSVTRSYERAPVHPTGTWYAGHRFTRGDIRRRR